MDPFNQTSTNFSIDDEPIVVYGEKRGKTNTYVVGLSTLVDSQTLTKTLEKMKKSFGCGGSIKEVEYDGKEVVALHLQGDKVAKVTEFITQMNLGKVISKPVV